MQGTPFIITLLSLKIALPYTKLEFSKECQALKLLNVGIFGNPKAVRLLKVFSPIVSKMDPQVALINATAKLTF